MSMRLMSVTIVAAVTACHGSSTRAPGNSGGADAPADLLTRATADARPVVVRDGVAYLWLHLIEPFADQPEWAPERPACADDEPACWKSVPAPAERAAQFGALPATLTVITPTGTCQAKVLPVVVFNTAGCEPSMTYGAPLTGCGEVLAPIGFAGGDVAADLRWLPAPTVDSRALPADPGALADPLQRRLVTGWLADALAGTRHQARTAVVSVDAGSEALTTVVAGALVGDSAEECEWEVRGAAAIGLRHGDQLTPIHLATGYGEVNEWDGALAWRGRVVGVASGLPREIVVHALGADGTGAVVLSQTVWWDNEECTQGSWSGVEYPCGP